MVSIPRPGALSKPVSRLALMMFAWRHRHEILRWGRSLYDQLGRADLSPARAVRTGLVLFAIASDDRLRDAPQLRKVSMIGDEVDLEVDQSWPHVPHLVQRVRSVKGVRRVKVNGVEVAPPIRATARDVPATNAEPGTLVSRGST